MTLQCWMHWFWITLLAVITVLPNGGLCLPVPATTGLSSILHQVPSRDNIARPVLPLENSRLNPELDEVVSAATLAPIVERINTTLNKPKTVYATIQNIKSNAENRVLTYDQGSNRNRVDTFEATRLTEGTFPIPTLDDLGDLEGALHLSSMIANIDVKTETDKQIVYTPDTTIAQAHDDILRFNSAVDADNKHSNQTVTSDLSNCPECSTTIAAPQELPDQTTKTIETITEINESETLSSENITGLEDLGHIHQESTEEVLSRSSLTVQERREQLGNSLGHAANNAETNNGMDPGAIAGISLGVLAIATLASAASFVLYRTRYLNNPQTLSDKCSNPDSSGYIDDSTIRENSEEMYSLDNDSFLNSLEAMTIQNYWTDSVKHTKL